jgi:hypothetical protein
MDEIIDMDQSILKLFGLASNGTVTIRIWTKVF